MEQGEKSIRLVTALVECRPDGEYVPWGIKWYDGTVYPFDRNIVTAGGLYIKVPSPRSVSRPVPPHTRWGRAG